MLKNTFFFPVMVILLSACASSHKVAESVKPENLSYNTVAEKFQSQLHDYHTATFKAKVDVKQKKTQSFTIQVRMVRDSIIWASLTGSMGVEGARIIITPDSIHILDKLKKIYYRKPFGFVQEFVPFSVSINLLQNLMLGNHPLDHHSEKSFSVEDAYIISETTEKLNNLYYIHPQTYVPIRVLMNEQNSNRQLAISYNDYRPLNDTAEEGKWFSYHRIVDFKSRKKTKITIRFLRLGWNEPITFPFSVGEKYEIRF